MEIILYKSLLAEIKDHISQAQMKATFAVNAEMIRLYWEIGNVIANRQAAEGWSAGVIPRLAKDLKNDFSELKGFSERNLGYMLRFAKEYQSESILQQLVAKLAWGHNILLLEKIKDTTIRFWYMQACIENGWSRELLAAQIKSNLYERSGKSLTNFSHTLPNPLSDLVQQSLKDPYIFDFITLAQPYKERDIENQIIKHITKFLLELGKGFAFVGRQYQLTIAENDYYIDLLFYHIRLKCYVVIELKNTKFMPEYAGKLNFYLSAVDTLVKQADDNPSIGLLLCKDKNKIEVEFALRDIHKPMGISEFTIMESLPDNIKSSLPTIAEIENELKNL